MDTEQIGAEVVESPDSPQQEIEKEVVSKVETPIETLPEKSPAVDEESESAPVNGHAEEEDNITDQNEEELPKEDPKIEADVDKAAGEGAETNQPEQAPEQEEKPLAEEQKMQTFQEVATTEQPVPEIPKEEEKVAEKLEAKVEALNVKDEVGDIGKEGGVTVLATVEDKKIKETEKATGDQKPAETKEATPDPKEEVKEKSATTQAESTTTTTAAEGGEKVEEKEPEPEEDPTPATGSLAFAILEQEKTKDALITTRTMIVLRGLPGSGKSFLARAIAEAYKDQCAVISGDDHGVKPESTEVDGYKALDEAVVSRCSANTSPVLIVVDDTNHTQDRCAHLGRIAKQNQLVTIFLEPRTEWSRDAALLTKKTKRGLDQAKIEALKSPFEEASIPLYFGWFLFFTAQDKVKERAMEFLKTLANLENFKKHLSDFGGQEEKEVDLEQYFKAKGTLHCTTKFTNYGKAEGAKEYTQKQAVKDMYASAADLSLTALFVTPRTVGARVSLTDDQLQLWPDDAEKEAESVVPSASTLPPGSRAHVTLGCAEGVQAVQTGLDLLQILLLQKDGQQGEITEELDPGTLTYFGEGRWYLALKEPVSVPACFSSVYKAKAPGQPKKEKMKKKCTIL